MKKNLYLFYGSIFFQHFSYGIIIPTLILWQNRNGLSFGEIALIQSIGLIFLMSAEVPSSFFADKIGRKTTLVLGLLLTLFAFIFLILASDFMFFLLSQIFFSIGLAFLSGTEEAFLHDIVPSKKMFTRYLGSMHISDELGTIFGIFMSSLLIQFSDITLSFQAAFISLMLSLFLIIVAKSNPTDSDEKDTRKINQDKLLFAKISIPLFILMIIFGLFAERGELAYQYAFSDLGGSLESLGLIYLIAKFFSIIGSRLAHFVENKIKTHTALILFGIFQVATFALLIADSRIIAIISLCFFFFSENIFRNIRSSFILKNSPHDTRATNLSLVSFSSSMILIFSKMLIGWSLDIKLLYAIMFIVALKIIAIFLLTNIFKSKAFSV